MPRTKHRRHPGKPRPRGKQRDSHRAEVFVRHLLIDGNHARSARAAGYPANGAREQAYRLLQDPDIQALYAQRRDEALRKLGVTIEDVHAELKRVGFARMDHVGEIEDGSFRVHSWDDVPESTRAAVAKVEQTEHGVKVTMHPKVPALLALARLLMDAPPPLPPPQEPARALPAPGEGETSITVQLVDAKDATEELRIRRAQAAQARST